MSNLTGDQKQIIQQISRTLMEKANEPYLKMIAKHLIERAKANEDLRSMLMDSSKTLQECYAYIKKEARAKAKNGCACIEDSVVYGWAEEYYGVKTSVKRKNAEKIKLPTEIEQKSQAKSETKTDNIPGQIDLMSFLGEEESE